LLGVLPFLTGKGRSIMKSSTGTLRTWFQLTSSCFQN
jgi:hypothetical protein